VEIQVVPESPSPDDDVSIKAEVTFAGTGVIPADGLPLQVTAARKGETGQQTATAILSRVAGAG